MAGPKSLPTHTRLEMERVIREAGELDRRRQIQIANQVDSMNRLLAKLDVPDPEAGAKEIAVVHLQLATAAEKLQRIGEICSTEYRVQDDELKGLRGQIDSIVKVLEEEL